MAHALLLPSLLMRLLDLRPLACALMAPAALAGAGVSFWQNRRRTVRSERELIEVIGPPLLAARPLRPEALRALSQQLLEHWFNGSRTLLPVATADDCSGHRHQRQDVGRGLHPPDLDQARPCGGEHRHDRRGHALG